MNVTLIGTGLMGAPMARRLLRAGHTVRVYNRTLAKAQILAGQGARVAATPAEAISGAEYVLLALSDAQAITDVLAQIPAQGLAGKTIIQMGTIGPRESLRFQQQIETCGAQYGECPVLGSRREAEAGTLILMVGSTLEQFKMWQGLLKAFGPQPRHVGKVGQAAALKLALNQLIAAHAVSFALSLGIVEKNSIDVDLFMNILEGSALFAPMFAKKLPNWRERSYNNPNFPTKHLLKDARLILAEARAQGIATDGISAAVTLLEKAVAGGFGDKDYSSVFNVINNL